MMSSLFGIPLLVFVFLLLASHIGTKNPFFGFDAQLLGFISELRTPFFNEVFLFITLLGKGVVIAGFACVFITYLLYKKHYGHVLPFLVAIIGTAFTVSNAKVFIGRERPGEDIAYYLEQSLSFPSGHSALSMAFFGYLAYYALRKGISGRKFTLFLSLFLIFLIGFSRMYLGVHYLSDVIGGYIVGLLWLVISSIFLRISKVFQHIL